jgi:hypothetical protein
MRLLARWFEHALNVAVRGKAIGVAKVMTHEEHAKYVGAIITNLQSLETVIRIFLAAVNGQSWAMPKAGDLEVDENYLTNFRAFGPLINRYNETLTVEERAKYSVNTSHVRIRDAFAHGRLLSAGDVFPATLYKFGPARDGKVPVEFCEVLTKDWMDETRASLRDDHRRVAQCFTGRDFNGARMDLP